MELRETLKHLLGNWQDVRPPVTVSDCTLERFPGHVQETLRLDLGDGTPVEAIVTRPHSPGPHPAVLYLHAHGGRYHIGARELTDGRPSLLGPYGPLLAERGYFSLCLDMPTFGSRQSPDESILTKRHLWYGGTLFGQMLVNLAQGLDYLCQRPDVDRSSITTLGLSMGATQSFWLAALDPRVTACLHLCCYADLATLVESGAHDLHGIYMTVPGLLAATSTGQIAGLVAPRPQLICVGEDDPLTPPAAISRAYGETLDAYQAASAADRLEILREAGVGHRETPAMRATVLRYLPDLMAQAG